MIRDVFYYGAKPNAHPREKHAIDLADARNQCTTEHFWIINEYCDYTNFDWDWDFDFLPDEDVWAEEHTNVWPSPYQKDSGTWLCPKQDSQVIIYRADVEPITLKDVLSSNWKIIETIDKSSFDFKWHPDPTEDPYIYVFGNQWYSGIIMPTVEYHVLGATDRKYIKDKIAQLLSMPELFNMIHETVDFDYSWRPDPTSPPYIYVFGNTQYPSTIMPTIEYHVEGANEKKYIENFLPKLKSHQHKFNILEDIDTIKFDFSWVPDPTSPPYIYVFGNTQYPATIMPTVEYHVEGATERKYVDDIVAHLLPIQSVFNTIHETLDFDYSWRPDPTSPPYIYVFGNTQYPGNIMPTIEYVVEGATELKYIDDIVPKLAHQPHKFTMLEDIDTSKFDFSWVPNPTSPPYIYAWGNQWNKPEDKISVQYVVEGATEYKYMEHRATRKACADNWQTHGYVIQDSFDYSWEPNPNDNPYIYQFGTQWQKTGGPTFTAGSSINSQVKYIDLFKAKRLSVKNEPGWYIPDNILDFDYSWHPDNTEPKYTYQFGSKHSSIAGPKFVAEASAPIKYMDFPVATIKPDMTRWYIPDNIDTTDFDFSWTPDLADKPYMYEFGTQWQKTGGPRYTVEGATEVKYVDTQHAVILPDSTNWITNYPTEDFDYSWNPDATEEPYIYQFPSQWSRTGGPCYTVEGATEIKYVDVLSATVKPDMKYWLIPDNVDTTGFDFSWHPDVEDQPYVYEFGTQWQKTGGPILTAPLCNESTPVKYVDITKAKMLPNMTNWITHEDVVDFDYSWHPDTTEQPYIYQWGNKHYSSELKPTVEYIVPGATQIKHMSQDVKLTVNDNWIEHYDIDKNKFDMTWRPDPSSPPYIYIWGNKHVEPELKSTLEYRVEGATEIKYMSEQLAVLPEFYRWNEIHSVDRTKFDLTWRPDPREPAYIYVWGNKWIPGELESTIEYHCPEATEKKYMESLVDVLPQQERWNTIQQTVNFDYSWRPDPREPAYIYTWGNKHISGELKPTVEYYCPNAIERKYMGDVEVSPEMDRWNIVQDVAGSFDLTWRPDPREPAYIYVWGNKYITGELKSTIEYHCPNATEKKHMGDADVIPEYTKWKITQDIDKTKFDMMWRPDPREPAYIYVWGNKHIDAELKPTIEYYCEGATERKYMGNIEVLPEFDKWVEVQSVDRTKFDLTWRPDPREPAYIYTWGNKHISAELKPTIEYHCQGATEHKYMGNADVIPDNNWSILLAVDNSFDFTWRPDPREPAFVYVWGNQHNRGEIEPTVEYHTAGATDRKYMDDPITVLPDYKNWTETQLVDRDKFDFSWRPDPTSPPYIYVWGNKHISAELKPTIEYHTPGASEHKYMGNADVIPDNNWSILLAVDNSFDFTWRPDPREPAFVYVWGNQHNRGEIEPTVEYHTAGATERKYMDNPITVLPDYKNWTETQPVNRTKFDFSWRPDPSSPPYIYVWGNKYITAELKPTLTYTVPGATEYKYFQEPIEVLPESDRWNIVQEPDNFDFTWRPDPREPAYIYVWGNKHISGELKSTIEYHCPNSTERKYVGNIDVKPEWDRYQVLIPVDKTSFDFTWRPDPREPAYIYVWGNQSNSAETEPTIEYHCEGATERKYITDTFVKTLPVVENWKILIPVDNFDFSWRPDPHSPPYIYVFGNQWHDATTEPTLEYHVEGATTRKFITDVIPNVTRTQENWQALIPVESFDYSWRPNPHSAPYIYVFGNQWHNSIKEPTVEYRVPGATDKKYIDDIRAIIKSTATESHWKRLISIESFDYSWRPDPHSPPFIYVFGNKWNDATTEPSIEYHVHGAIEYKYINDPVAIPQANLAFWSINNNDDLDTFDFTWRPNPHSPAQIYQWADNGPRYTMPDSTEVVFMERTVEIRKAVVNRYKIKTTLEDLIAEHSEEVFWAINPDLTYEKFDFSWRPNEENFRHVNAFGNEYSINTQTYYVNGPLYMMGHKEFNYVEGQTVVIDSNLAMFYIDKGNSESAQRFEQLKTRYPQTQKTRYLNTWVDTINRCVTKSNTNLCWILNSELDYTEFEFDFYPSPWQQRMVHVFGTQWSHWGTTFMVNKESFPEDTKYVKIIEHLNVLNFVKSKKAKAVNILYDVVYIDHGNMYPADYEGKTVIKYDNSYLKTFKKLLEQLPIKNEHYIWIASSVCDYSKFDFTYIGDPYAREHLHVFPSDKQKFGDTFLINVNKLRSLVNDMITLEDYGKINYNQHQRANRLPAPNIITTDDTHCKSIQQDFDFPYAVFTTTDNSNMVVNDIEPMSLWSPNTKNIIITSSGGSRIIVPKEAKSYIDEELYDYPYITKVKNITKSNPMDIVFLSNGEIGADENYEHLLKVTDKLPNRVVRVDGINGRVASYHAAATASSTPWMFTVFAKLKVNNNFDWTWQPDRLQVPKHYIFHATNPVNGLEYGHQAMIAYNKQITLGNMGKGLDFTLDSEHEVVELNSGVARYNTDAFSTWRTSFREAIKLRLDDSTVSRHRLKIWSTVGEGDFSQYSINGALDAVEYFEQVNGELDKLRLSYDWPWLEKYFNAKYN